MPAQGALSFQSIAVYAVVGALVIYRVSVPRRVSVTRMWVMAGILMALAVLAIVAYERMNPAPAWEIAIAIVGGLVAGIPVGLLRGYHTKVSATERPGVMQLGASWATAGIYLGAFALRAGIRYLVPMTSPAGSIVGDALLVFAIAIVGASYYAVYRTYQTLEAVTITTSPVEPRINT
jgi:hypothetical protein